MLRNYFGVGGEPAKQNFPRLEHLAKVMWGPHYNVYSVDRKTLPNGQHERVWRVTPKQYDWDDLMYIYYFIENYMSEVMIQRNLTYSDLEKLAIEAPKKFEQHLPSMPKLPDKSSDEELRKRKAVGNGFTLPGYNFCGPGNCMDHMPASYVDALCQLHD